MGPACRAIGSERGGAASVDLVATDRYRDLIDTIVLPPPSLATPTSSPGASLPNVPIFRFLHSARQSSSERRKGGSRRSAVESPCLRIHQGLVLSLPWSRTTELACDPRLPPLEEDLPGPSAWRRAPLAVRGAGSVLEDPR